MIRAASFGSHLKLPLLRLLAASGFFAFLVTQSPHLVHHLFEPGQKKTDCAFASAAERAQELTVGVAPLIAPPELGIGGWVADRPELPSAALTLAEARAPPLLAS